MELILENTEILLNLTTGLEHLADSNLHSLLQNPQFVRLQSTYCELAHWEKFLQDVDYNLLMKLAIGKTCVVLDCTSRKLKGNVSRACWQGLAWLEYCLNRIWFDREITLDQGMHVHFKREYHKLSKCTLKRFKYFRKFLKCDKIDLRHYCIATDHDGDIEFYQKIVNKYL